MSRSIVSLVAALFAMLFAPSASPHLFAAHAQTVLQGRANVNSPALPAIPIMLYHHVGEGKTSINGIWYVPIKSFEEQTQYLAENGFHTTTLAAYMNAYTNQNSEMQPQSIALTLDDAFDDAYTTVFPLLRQYGMVGTFFIITGRFVQPRYLTWRQIKGMPHAGIEFAR